MRVRKNSEVADQLVEGRRRILLEGRRRILLVDVGGLGLLLPLKEPRLPLKEPRRHSRYRYDPIWSSSIPAGLVTHAIIYTNYWVVR